MITGKRIPFINENLKMKSALQIISKKKLGVLVVKNKKGLTTGIFTDGDVKRASQKNKDLLSLNVQKVMTKNPISIEKNVLAAKALSIMNSKKITSLCVHNKNMRKKTIGIIHIHSILEANVQ
jgi:arabinose-5-phosphate isomerase